jgi:hypothetical protein
VSSKCTVEGCGKWSFQGGLCRGHALPPAAAAAAAVAVAAAATAWDEKKQLDELSMHMYGFLGKACRQGKYSPNTWSDLENHFTLSRDVCLAHAKANLEAICDKDFCCSGGSDGSHFHSLKNGTYQMYHSDRGEAFGHKQFSADEAAEMFVQTCGFFAEGCK